MSRSSSNCRGAPQRLLLGAIIMLGSTRCASPDDAEHEIARITDSPRPAAPIHDDEPAAPAPMQQVAEDEVDVASVSVRGARGAPTKGDPLSITVVLESAQAGTLSITPRIDSARFVDFIDVPLATVRASVRPGTNTITVTGGPFLTSDDGSRHFALGSGAYTVSRIQLLRDGETSVDARFLGGEFRIAESRTLLVPVVYDDRYLTQIAGSPYRDADAYLRTAFTRASEVFTPSGADPDGPGQTTVHLGGFDQMMNVRHLFRTFAGFPGSSTTSQGYCEDAAEYARRVLGMRAPWDGRSAGTKPERHGFDYLIGLTPEMGGGAACGWLDVQVSSFIERDLARQHVIVVHESGHLFGAPHCDDVGDGQGGLLQGFVMCSGEKHPHYPARFVWHARSVAQMDLRWQ